MKPSRSLSLKKETLVELGTDDLRSIAAGAPTQACPTGVCVSGNVNCLLTVVSAAIYPCLSDRTCTW